MRVTVRIIGVTVRIIGSNGTDNASKGTDNASNGTDNASKGTGHSKKGTGSQDIAFAVFFGLKEGVYLQDKPLDADRCAAEYSHPAKGLYALHTRRTASSSGRHGRPHDSFRRGVATAGTRRGASRHRHAAKRVRSASEARPKRVRPAALLRVRRGHVIRRRHTLLPPLRLTRQTRATRACHAVPCPATDDGAPRAPLFAFPVPLFRLSVPLFRLPVPLFAFPVPLFRLSVPLFRLPVPLFAFPVPLFRLSKPFVRLPLLAFPARPLASPRHPSIRPSQGGRARGLGGGAERDAARGEPQPRRAARVAEGAPRAGAGTLRYAGRSATGTAGAGGGGD
jgi:hypothetical protein